MSSAGNGEAHDDDLLALVGRVTLLEQAHRGYLGENAEMLAKIRDLHESRRLDREVLGEMSVKLDRLLVEVPKLARRRERRKKR